MTDTNRHDQHVPRERRHWISGVAEQHMQLLCLKLAQGRQRRNLLAHQIRMIGRHGPCPMPDTQRVTGDGGAARPSLTLERAGAHEARAGADRAATSPTAREPARSNPCSRASQKAMQA